MMWIEGGRAKNATADSKAMNLPNSLTLLRILCSPVFVGLVLYGHHSWALAVFLTAGLTDALDGMLARLLNQQTTLGQYLDPLADKLLLVTAFVVLSFDGAIPLWVALVVVSRDVIISVGSLVIHLLREQVDITPTWMGKTTTVIQLIYIVAVLGGTTVALSARVVGAILAVMIALTVASGLHYVFRGVKILNLPSGRPA
jgi:cardiolipin synthase